MIPVTLMLLSAGRYQLTARECHLREHFGLGKDFSWTLRWNTAPTQPTKVKLNFFFPALLCLITLPACVAQDYTIANRGTFIPQNKKILLLKSKHDSQRDIILFETNLRVNTDGSAKSYHPQDLLGKEKALNNICNAVAVRKQGSKKNLCLGHSTFSHAIGIFKQFRDSRYERVPEGFEIGWDRVLARDGKTRKPCIFMTGEFKGYFGSLTALKNGLPADKKGECEVNDQVDPLTVPTLVLAGGNNPLQRFGARTGDLVLAFNTKNQSFSTGVIGDVGPADNLGEGSVALNMKLLGKNVPPTNKAETFNYAVNMPVLIAVIPASVSFHLATPYTAGNIGPACDRLAEGSRVRITGKVYRFHEIICAAAQAIAYRRINIPRQI